MRAVQGEVAWRWQGDLSAGALDLSTTFLVRDRTLMRPAPPPSSAVASPNGESSTRYDLSIA